MRNSKFNVSDNMTPDAKSYLDKFPTVHPLRTRQQYDALLAAAAADENHVPIAPTHYVCKDGEIVGCFHAGWTCYWWMHSRKCNLRDSTHVMGILQATLLQLNIDRCNMFMSRNSNYYPLMQRLGFEERQQLVLFSRPLETL